jgi:8-oxo-dGTP pyrophosphatase MutT (NUDIX family)
MLHNKVMNKNKVQVVLFKQNPEGEKEFLLLKTNERRGLFWQSVTGSVEKGEDFKTAAFREVLEETNCQAENITSVVDLEMDFEFKDQWGDEVYEKVFAFEIKDNFELILDPKEHIEFKWVKENFINRDSVKFETNYEAIKKCLK